MQFYFFAFFWGLLILAAFIGWGNLLFLVLKNRILNTKSSQAAAGIAVSVFFGGVLNLLHQVSKWTVLVYLVVGAAWFICTYVKDLIKFRHWKLMPPDKVTGALFAVIVAIIFVRFALAVSYFPFHVTDDQHAYLAFPAQMLQTGSLPPNPFSERRIISSLGGKYFLDTFVLSALDFKNLHLVEDGIGFVIFMWLLWNFLRRQNLDKNFSLLILLLAALITSPSGNITSFYTGSCLFLLFFWMLFNDNGEQSAGWRQAILVALISAGLCALKTNFIPPCAALFLAYYFIQFRKSGLKTAAKKLIMAVVFLAVFLSPWMIAMKQTSGTFLYPILGKGVAAWGFDGVAGHLRYFNLYGLERLVSEFVLGLSLFLPFVLLALSARWIASKHNRLALSLIFISCLIGILALIYGIGGYSLYYYSFPFLMPAVIVGLIIFLGETDVKNLNLSSNISAAIAIFFLLFSVGVYFQKDVDSILLIKSAVAQGSSGALGFVKTDLVSPAQKLQYQNLQNSVPEGQIILARLDRNYYFNFQRNPVYIIDMPGAVSLAAGLPSFQGPEALATYLLSKNIRYIAYSYADQANFTRAGDGTMLAAHVNPWLRDETAYAFDFQDNVTALGQSRKRIYDDGQNFVLDLSVKQ